jgi:hypothetical protein
VTGVTEATSAARRQAGMRQQQQGMQTHSSSCDASVGWDLVLHPPQLQAAFWRDHSRKFMTWDLQVCLGQPILQVHAATWHRFGQQRCVLLLLLHQVVCSLLVLSTVSCVRHALSTGPFGPHARVYLPVSRLP